jgi:hypothetical protein
VLVGLRNGPLITKLAMEGRSAAKAPGLAGQPHSGGAEARQAPAGPPPPSSPPAKRPASQPPAKRPAASTGTPGVSGIAAAAGARQQPEQQQQQEAAGGATPVLGKKRGPEVVGLGIRVFWPLDNEW